MNLSVVALEKQMPQSSHYIGRLQALAWAGRQADRQLWCFGSEGKDQVSIQSVRRAAEGGQDHNRSRCPLEAGRVVDGRETGECDADVPR